MTAALVDHYLIHLESKLGNSQHYCGSTEDWLMRCKQHQASSFERFPDPQIVNGTRRMGVKHGLGATFLAAANSAGIRWAVVRLWRGPRELEQELKRRKKLSHFCPICNPEPQPELSAIIEF